MGHFILPDDMVRDFIFGGRHFGGPFLSSLFCFWLV